MNTNSINVNRQLLSVCCRWFCKSYNQDNSNWYLFTLIIEHFLKKKKKKKKKDLFPRSRSIFSILHLQMHDSLPVATDSRDGLEAARCQLVRSSEAAVHSPVEQIDLVWVEFQEQDDHLTAQTVHLGQTYVIM